ncbi:MAG TPA: hypothetical protein VK994_02710 [Bacteroidales bacterium]|nr:hypothetical protein [Bacteroidales bacterium]
MDGFSYHDIFQTKGVEYLVIIAFLFLLIPFWLAINKKVNVGSKLNQALGAITFGAIRIPQGVFFHRNHTWSFLEKTGFAQLGIDDMLLQMTGKVVIEQHKNPGEIINKGELMAEIRQNGKSLRVYSPISGEVISLNHIGNNGHKETHADPFDDGWIYRVAPHRWKEETASCLLGNEARQWVRTELERFKDFVAHSAGQINPGNPGMVLQEGGEISESALEALPEKVWKDFQKEFLDL